MINISKMSGKLQGIGAINTNTLTNAFCKARHTLKNTICRKCYSFKMLQGHRKNCIPNFEQNSVILSSAIIDFDLLPVINAAFFRFSAHGELINQIHFENLCNIAEKNPYCTFALWTKRVSIVRQYQRRNDVEIPNNLILIFSNPAIDKPLYDVPRGFHKVFNNVSKGSNYQQNCTGKKCIECLTCYHKMQEKNPHQNTGGTIIIEAVK